MEKLSFCQAPPWPDHPRQWLSAETWEPCEEIAPPCTPNVPSPNSPRGCPWPCCHTQAWVQGVSPGRQAAGLSLLWVEDVTGGEGWLTPVLSIPSYSPLPMPLPSSGAIVLMAGGGAPRTEVALVTAELRLQPPPRMGSPPPGPLVCSLSLFLLAAQLSSSILHDPLTLPLLWM